MCFSRVKIWVYFSRVYFSDHCCIYENFCGIHLTNFLAFCYLIYGRKARFLVILMATTDRNCSEGQTNVPEHFPRISENFWRCPKISKVSRRLSRKTRRCFDNIPTNLSTIKRQTWSLNVKISYRFYQFVTTRYTTDFYIVINNI